MSYWYSDRTGVQSYVQGVNYGALMQEALNPKNKSEENKRLSTTSTQDDYFRKQQLIKEAVAQLQSNGYVEPKIAKEVNVEALKESLQQAGENNSSALGMLGNMESSEATKQSQMAAQEESMLKSAINIADKMQVQPPMDNPLADAKIEDLELQRQMKETIKQSVENDTLVNREGKKGGILNQTIVQTSPKAPSNITQEAKDVYNPLVVSENTEALGNGVEFVDEVSGKKVRVPLNDANTQKLIDKFGSLDEASDYVKGFYYDAAYKMGYLSNDSNQDGTISVDEGIHLKSLVSLLDGNYYSIAERIGSDEAMQKKFLEQVGFIDNIGDFINHAMSQDSNVDGALNLNEMLDDDGKAVLFKVGSSNVEMFVVWRFNFDFTQESLNDTLLNLGASEQKDMRVINAQDVKIHMDSNYLESLDETERANVLKSEILLKNLLGQNAVENV